jgi:hypothetical protein
LSDAIWNAITQLGKPMEKYGLPTLEPFLIKSLDAKSVSQAASFQLRVKNLKLHPHQKIILINFHLQQHEF